ncbi:Transaldolase [Ceratocystis fimbriata CBS 114723]|uniref:Transaldolase n=1 Tax=Ceratocystis fimbriata CBS 114723 TaxID=1035309 RepID=A0A2C5XBT1_9PEZI|nr:Transaldolase [Ceratocystis fimbriata CBS 114723]
MAATKKTMLQLLEEQVDVDVDWMDPEFIRSNDRTFHDMTSNQFIVDAQIGRPENRDLIVQAAQELGTSDWLAVYTRVAAKLCANNLPYLRGRVFLQTRPADAFDATATLKYARQIAAEFARLGVGCDRYAIKIPITGAGMTVAKALRADGVASLGTVLLNVDQAIAASQAGCYYVSPYFNEIKAHVDRTVWPELRDPAADHPMAPRVAQIYHVYRELYASSGTEQPRVKLASLISMAECMVPAELGCHSITVPMPLLVELAATPATMEAVRVKPEHPYAAPAKGLAHRLEGLLKRDPLRESWDGVLPSLETDYLADGGKALDEAVEKDTEAKKRLDFALEFFDDAEKRSKEVVEAVLKAM